MARNRWICALWGVFAVCSVILVGCGEEPAAVQDRSTALTGSHQVIVAYYPIFPRWEFDPAICPDHKFIGDVVRQYPLLGLYNNTTDQDVQRFDFQALASAGATVVNPHTFSQGIDYGLFDRIDRAAGQAGLMWTPTFEAHEANPGAMAAATSDLIHRYGPSSRLMRVDGGRPVFFWRLHGPGIDGHAVAAAIEQVRAVHGPVMIILDETCQIGQPCQIGNGNHAVSQWFKDLDASTGQQRVTGFYSWVSVGWALKSRPDRRSVADRFVRTSQSNGFLPVLSATPSYNEEHWGYGTPGNNCGVGGDRSHQPRYNTQRSVREWTDSLRDVLTNNPADAWLYLQAYDEWGEGTTLAPTTYSCFEFLAGLRQVLQEKGWLADGAGYCRPDYPRGYSPSACNATQVCSGGGGGDDGGGGCTAGGSEPAAGGSSSEAIARYEAEARNMGHLTGFETSSGWRVLAGGGCQSDTYLVFGPYARDLPAGELTARFWLSVDNNTADDRGITRIEVYDATAQRILAQQELSRRDWSAANQYLPFDLGFGSPGAGHELEFRTLYHGWSQLDEDKIEVIGVGGDDPPDDPPDDPRPGEPLATYQAEAQYMGHLTGREIAGGWRVGVGDPHETYATYGPYAGDLPAGDLAARFWLCVDNNSADNAEICRVEAFDATAQRLLASRVLSRRDWSAASRYLPFDLGFTNPGQGHELEFRTYYIWYSRLDQDRIEVLYSGAPDDPPDDPPPADFDAEYESQIVPATLVPGERFPVQIRMRNTGSQTWTEDSMHRLAYGGSGYGAATTWGRNRITLPSGQSVASGAAHTFSAELTAPAEPGSYMFRWQMLREATRSPWFGELSAEVTIEVQPDDPVGEDLDAAFVGQQVPGTVTAGQRFEATVRMRNTGTQTWTRDAMHRLAFGGPGHGADSTWGRNRMTIAAGQSVPSGSEYSFSAELIAPAEEGPYRFQWQMLVEATADPWFGEMSDSVDVRVVCSEGASRSVGCAADPSRVQPQVCVNGAWQNSGACLASGPQYSDNPYVFDVRSLTGGYDDDPPRGLTSLILGYLDHDNEIDFVLVGETGITAYDHWGNELWALGEVSTYNQRTDRDAGTLLGYHSTAGVIGNNAFYCMARNQRTLIRIDGATGSVQRRDVGYGDWTDVGLGHVLSTSGSEDVILLKDGYIGGATGYRNTNRVAALRDGSSSSSWVYETPYHVGIAFAHMRVADLDGDGYDEVCPGRICIDHDGATVLARHSDPVWGQSPQASYTSLQVADLDPGNPGLEAFIGHYFIGRYGVHSFLFGLGGHQRTYASESNVHSAVIGNADLRVSWSGPEALIRSNKDGENDPPDVRKLRFLNLATGEELIQDHIPQNSWMHDVDSNGYSPRGSYPRFIDWNGDAQQEVALVERHIRNPKVSVNSAFDGRLLMETAHRGNGEGMARIFDVSGDGREEVVVWNRAQIAIYWNGGTSTAPMKRTDRAYMLRSRHGSFVYNYPQ